MISEKTNEVLPYHLNKDCFGKIACGYFRLIGETHPILSNLTVMSEGKTVPQNVYEYLWMLSLTGDGYTNWVSRLKRGEGAIQVQIFFHTNGTNFMVRPLTGDIKSPFAIKQSLVDRLYDASTMILGRAIRLIGDISKVPGIKETGQACEDVVTELGKNAAPSCHAFSWHSKLITTNEVCRCSPWGFDEHQIDGVEWNINSRAFYNIGNQITGGVGVIFIKSSEVGDDYLELEARARLCFKNRDLWIPCDPADEEAFKEDKLLLKIHPQLPDEKKA